MKRVVLRLDSGALIGPPSEFGIDSSDPVVRISPEDAAKIGRLDYSHVLRVRKLLRQAVEELGYDPKKCPELETDEDVEETQQEAVMNDTPPKKRDRGWDLMGKSGGRQQPLPTGSMSSPSSDVSPTRLEFYDKCFKILEDTIQHLGTDASIFMVPVDPGEVPDYLTIVKEPMDLGTIQKRLEQEYYDNPLAFARVPATAIGIFREAGKHKGDYIEKIGNRASANFENRWAESGFAEEEPRKRRTTAGLRPNKYEPEEPNAETPTKKTTKTGSRNAKGRTKQAKPGKQTTAGDVDDISSKVENATYEDRPMPTTQIKYLADCLSEVGGQVLSDVIEIIQKNSDINMNNDDGNEIELEMSDLNLKTLWKLDAYLKEHKVTPNAEQDVVVNKGSTTESSSSSGFGSSGSDSDASSKPEV